VSRRARGDAILERIDRIMRELLELRDAVSRGAEAAAEKGVTSIHTPDDDFAPVNLIEISTAVDRFNRPADTIRYWCRREGDGKKIGGRWMASAARIRRRLNGE
jgi:hypothetical protein